MARSDAAIVADAGPIIHLDELGCLDLLGDLGTILLPRAVFREVAAHRAHIDLGQIPHAVISDVQRHPSERAASLCDALALGAGERAAICLLETLSATMFLCDDAAARLAAESLGFTVHGTLGILIRSIRVGRRTRDEVVETIRQIRQRSSLHVSGRLLDRVIDEVESTSST